MLVGRDTELASLVNFTFCRSPKKRFLKHVINHTAEIIQCSFFEKF